MNLRTGRWDSVLLDIFGIEKNKLCDLIDPGELHGYTNEKFAESTRLKTEFQFIRLVVISSAVRLEWEFMKKVTWKLRVEQVHLS